MEPTELKPTPPDDALENWLQANRSLPPLPDNGFARRVLTTLPRPARHRRQRSWLCLASLVVGGAVALRGILLSGHAVTDDLFVSLDHPLATPPALGAMAVVLGSLWYAFRDRLRSASRW